MDRFFDLDIQSTESKMHSAQTASTDIVMADQQHVTLL